MKWLDKTILVTGASGFIGGRLCERLVQDGATKVRALVHDPKHAARIARLPVELLTGDLLDRKSLERALRECQLVAHLGLGHGSGITRGTRNIVEAAQAAKVERFVHMSTAAVYGHNPSPGSVAEGTRPRRTGDVYCDSKLRAERYVMRAVNRGLAAVILRPSIVCGPYSRWSTRLIAELRNGRGLLIDGGAGICNTTYVDNLVDAVYRGFESDAAIGHAFFITDGERVTWGDFIRAHAAMFGSDVRLREVSTQEIAAYYKAQPGVYRGSAREVMRIVAGPEFRGLVKRVPIGDRALTWLWESFQALPDEDKNRWRARLKGPAPSTGAQNGFGQMPDRSTWAIQSGSAVLPIDKARRLLGYEPRISFARGMEFTRQWLVFAGYLPAASHARRADAS